MYHVSESKLLAELIFFDSLQAYFILIAFTHINTFCGKCNKQKAAMCEEAPKRACGGGGRPTRLEGQSRACASRGSELV